MTEEQRTLVIASLVEFVLRASSAKERLPEELAALPAISEILLRIDR